MYVIENQFQPTYAQKGIYWLMAMKCPGLTSFRHSWIQALIGCRDSSVSLHLSAMVSCLDSPLCGKMAAEVLAFLSLFSAGPFLSQTLES